MDRLPRLPLFAAAAGIAAAAGSSLRRTEVRGHSMEPTLAPGDYLLTRRLHGSPSRGDIVVAEHPQHAGMDLLKRVIGLPSEEVVIENGLVMIDGQSLSEPWAKGETTPGGRWMLRPGEVFLLGDNRTMSTGDGRATGPIAVQTATWRVVWRYWPRRKFGPVQ